jgi:hypothetical protein
VSHPPSTTLARYRLLWLQGGYFFFTGIWPLLSFRTFQAVTGPKTDHLVTGREGDHWLVMTVGSLISAIGLTLLHAAWRRTSDNSAVVLAVISAVALMTIDLIYVSRGVIAPIYLVDAAAEAILIGLWSLVLYGERRPRH